MEKEVISNLISHQMLLELMMKISRNQSKIEQAFNLKK